MAALVPVMFAVSLASFDMIGTAVFVLLAVAVSTLLGRVLEASNRRAFALELEQHRDARTDTLTGLDNRRAMQERGRIELKRAMRSGSAGVGDSVRPRSLQEHQRQVRARGRRRGRSTSAAAVLQTRVA